MRMRERREREKMSCYRIETSLREKKRKKEERWMKKCDDGEEKDEK